ncbi:unnamed protein product [Rotaria sp. Silwood1]|nr:unnamed protein product [Rotaria sp. Silwood1]
MDKLNKSLEFLKLLSTTASKILIIKGNNENYFKLVKASVETLFTTCDENDYNVRLTAEESLNKFVQNLKEADLTRIQVELYRIIKHNPNVEPNALKEYYELIFRSLGRPINDKEIKPIQQICYPIVIARFLMANVIDQLLEHQNQNASTRLIIDYLDLIKKIIQLLHFQIYLILINY